MYKDHVKKTIAQVYGLRPKNGLFGIELELEGTRLAVADRMWAMHEEGSLRGGIEYVSARPFTAAEVVPFVRSLRDAIAANRGVIHNSFRTSTHIHYNVINWSIEKIFAFITAFTLFEPLFLRMCGPQRDGNLFCMSSFDTGDIQDAFARACHDSHAGYPQVPNRGKYSTLNTGRLGDLGTVEFRCFPQSIDPDQIKTWCDWIEGLDRLVSREDDKTLRSLVKRAQRAPLEVAREVFGVTPLPADAEQLILFGCRTCYELTRIFQHYMNKKPAETKAAAPKSKKAIAREQEDAAAAIMRMAARAR